MSQVYPIVTDSVRVDRRRVYDNDDRVTHRVTFVLLEAADFQSPLKNMLNIRVHNEIHNQGENLNYR